ncbi:hypothetical protein MNV84_03768 [Leishmania braziliensis]|nr:hypothetical protein MNV84_03768 [Leishmania braziliensis]
MQQRGRRGPVAGLLGRRSATRAVSAVAVLLLVSVSCGAAGRPCTAEDITYFYSPCDQRTGKLTVLSYLPSDVNCEPGDLVVPPPRTTSCYNCVDGYHLNPATLECAACPAGTFSSYTTRYVNFDPLPEMLMAYCSPEPCAAWSAVEDTYGTVLSSGLQPTEGRPLTPWGTIDESVESTLDFFTVVTESAGVLEFDYSISSEEAYDGLQLRLNFSLVRNPDQIIGRNRFFATGVHRDWYHASIKLPQGHTKIQFQYIKDSTGPPYGEELTGVNDRALLRNIVIRGTRKTVADMQCISCPSGYWTTTEGVGGSGASECVRCPRNTYRSAHDTQCLACPARTSSPAGATECTPMRVCAASDYIAQYGSCLSDNTRVRSWVKYEGANCVEEEGSRPMTTKVECAACLPGMRHAGGQGRGACVSCPPGEYLLGEECKLCPLGTAAIPTLSYRSGFDDLGGNVTALSGTSLSYFHCSGSARICHLEQGKGFELVAFPFDDEDNTLVGIRQLRSANCTYSLATLNYTFNAEEDGWVNVTFAYVDSDGKFVDKIDWRTTMSVRLVVDEVTDYPIHTFARLPPLSDLGFYSLVVPYYVDTALPASDADPNLPGLRHRLSWIVEELAYTSNPISVVIVALEVFGDMAGGVAKCQPCRAGFSCPARASKMTPCSPGTIQPSARAEVCEACVKNTYTPGYGFTACTRCPSSTIANADHTGCSSACVFERNHMLYNFSDLRDVVLNTTLGNIPGMNTSLSNMTIEEADEASITRFYFSPCDPLPVADARTTSESDTAATPVTRDRLCVPSVRGRNSSSSAYVCQRTTPTNGRHFGDAVQHLGLGRHLYMITEQGSLAALDRFSFLGGNWDYYVRPYTAAYIELQCSMENDEPRFGTLVYVGESDGEAVLRWRSAYACPLCTKDSYLKVETTCDDPNVTTRWVYYTLRTDSFSCIGGYVPPEPIIMNCTECTVESYVVRWLDCNATTKTQDGVYVLIPEYANCTPSASPLPPVTPRPCDPSSGRGDGKGGSRVREAVLLVILVLLLAGLVVLTVYYRQLRERLARAARGEGAELDVYGGILDDMYGHDEESEEGEEPPLSRGTAATAMHQLWGVLTGMGQHIQDAVLPNDGGGSTADASAEARSGRNGSDSAATSDGVSAHPGGGGQSLFALAATDEDLLPGSR